MSHRRNLSRLAIATLTAALLAAPSASAMPVDPTGAEAADPRQQDMHGSTVTPPKDTKQDVRDARGEAAAGGGTTGGATSGGHVRDARGEAAAGGGTTGGATSGGAVRHPRLLPPPTWPAHPTPIPLPPRAQSPVATDGGDDVGVDLPVALLILAGTLALGGGLAVAGMKVRAHTRTAQ